MVSDLYGCIYGVGDKLECSFGAVMTKRKTTPVPAELKSIAAPTDLQSKSNDLPNKSVVSDTPRELPSETLPDILKQIDELPFEQLPDAEWRLCVLAARQIEFSVIGFDAHYTAVLRKKMPAHVRRWIAEFFKEYEVGKHRFLIKAARGTTKSTVFTILLSTYILAKFPTEGVLIVQEGDVAGSKTSLAISGIIKNNIGFKTAYPNIVPDEDVSWGAKGYEIKDTSIPYNQFRQKVLEERPKDPSFVGLGWGSAQIVGMHPTWLLLDDIHDKENTKSELEMESVKSTLKENILQTLNRPPGMKEANVVVSYTPWDKNDSYAFLESTGLYYQIISPIVVPTKEEDRRSFDYRGKRVRLLWEEVKDPLQYLADKESEFGPIGFATQMLLDLSAAEGKNLKAEWLHKYPVEKMDASWPIYFGVDYASTLDKIKDKERDYFTIAFARVIPGNGAVIFDGFRDRISRAEATDKLLAYVQMYHPKSVGVDTGGKGEEFYVDLLLAGVPVLEAPGPGNKNISKGQKFEDALAKKFFNSALWIADVETPFLKSFKGEWIAWDGTQRTHDDTLDAVYSAAYVMQGFLHQDKPTSNLRRKEKQPNPYDVLVHAY